MLNIRKFTATDEKEFITMCCDFYNTGATLYSMSRDKVKRTFDKILEEGPFITAYMMIYNDQIAGYVNLSFTYSNEADGIVAFIEELYVKPEYQGKSIGTQTLQFIFDHYNHMVKRYRLEVCNSNTDAIRLYEKLGFKNLDYKQMVIDMQLSEKRGDG